MSRTGQIKVRIHEYLELANNSDTPLLARFFFLAAVAYFLWPFDLIPDFIPVIGYLDDLIIVPLLIWLGYRQIEAARKTRNQQMLRLNSVGRAEADYCQRDEQ